jgi:hypothetical protein
MALVMTLIRNPEANPAAGMKLYQPLPVGKLRDSQAGFKERHGVSTSGFLLDWITGADLPLATGRFMTDEK